MKFNLRYLTDYSTNNGVTENPTLYHTLTPSLEFTSGQNIFTNVSSMNNIAITAYIRFTDITDSNFRVFLGTDATGNGQAIDFDFGLTSRLISFVNTTGLTNAPSSTITSKELYPRLYLNDNIFYKLKIIIANNDIKVFLNDYIIFESPSFVPTDLNIGFSAKTTANTVNISDVYYYINQVLWGNVNLNGVADENSVAILYKQLTGEVVEYVYTNSVGDYIIFIEDDPVNMSVYFIIGYILDRTDIQPRGIGNITL